MRKVMQQIEVSVNDDGEICIVQPGYGNDDAVVMISPDQVDVLTQWLKEAKAEASRMTQQAQEAH
jgi:hypothetical protein